MPSVPVAIKMAEMPRLTASCCGVLSGLQVDKHRHAGLGALRASADDRPMARPWVGGDVAWVILRGSRGSPCVAEFTPVPLNPERHARGCRDPNRSVK
jgi:hypothetical protein